MLQYITYASIHYLLLSLDPFCLANYMSQMHAVMYNPAEPRLLATANSKEGVGLWDIRKPRRYRMLIVPRFMVPCDKLIP